MRFKILRSLFCFALGFTALVYVGMVTGCAGISVTAETEDVLVYSAARAVGYQAALEYPELKKPAREICRTILAIEDEEQIKEMLTTLMKLYEADPLLVATVGDMMGLVNVETTEEFDVNVAQAKLVIAGVLEGIELTGSN